MISLGTIKFYLIICLVIVVLYIIASIKLKLKGLKQKKQLGKKVEEEENKQKKVWSFFGKI